MNALPSCKLDQKSGRKQHYFRMIRGMWTCRCGAVANRYGKQVTNQAV